MVRDKREGRLAGIRKSELTTPPAPNTMNVTNATDTTARLPHIYVDGYWRDDKTEFYGYVISQTDDIEEHDDEIFFYGLSESQIAESLGKETGADFVITAYAVA